MNKLNKFIFLVVILLIFLVGCSSGKNTKEKNENAKGYIFENKGITISMTDKATPILKKLGKEKDYFEANSCAFQGKDKTYTYSGFELHTYEKNKTDYVASVVFLDDSISTKEGINLDSSLDDVLKTYGNKYTEKSGVYTYIKDKTKLIITIKDKKIKAISYIAITE